MKEEITGIESASTVCYETMEAYARPCIQSWLQGLLEAEVTELLGRGKSQRLSKVGSARLGYRNGYGKPRRVALTGVDPLSWTLFNVGIEGGSTMPRSCIAYPPEFRQKLIESARASRSPEELG